MTHSRPKPDEHQQEGEITQEQPEARLVDLPRPRLVPVGPPSEKVGADAHSATGDRPGSDEEPG